jgi:phosphoglycolate phosphatase-like HAD superfamily hydrolase
MPDHPDGAPVQDETGDAQATAVVDLDGVLADVRHRLHHIERTPKDWDAFFAAAGSDPPLAEGFAVVRELADSYRIVYLSGRPERLRPATSRWLHRHEAPSGDLVLRRDGDRRPARQVKIGELRRLGRRVRIAVFVDDDPAVCAAATAAGFHVFRATWATGDGAAGTPTDSGRSGPADPATRALREGAEQGRT